jgi:Dyp-type peroxidase family
MSPLRTSSGGAPPIEWDDIQALVLVGHGHLPAARFLFLRAGGDRRRLQRWLSRIVPTTARPGDTDRPATALQVALSAAGLRALGLSSQVMATFLDEFREGMADLDRARAMGDEGDSAPDHWDFGGAGGPAAAGEIHLVLMLYAADRAALDRLHDGHRPGLEAAGLVTVAAQETALRADRREPFGFIDGIAQPRIEGIETSGSACSSEPALPLGELVLGYRNAYGVLPFSPSVPAALDPTDQLLPGDDRYGLKDLGRNGSYLVIRKLEQDVAGFHRFVAEKSQALAPSAAGPRGADWLAAKMMGRWRDGAPVTRARDQDDPALSASDDDDENSANAFDYRDDREGLGCPIGAHIRRANPRAGHAGDSPEQALALAARHRIIRRGRPYHEERPVDGSRPGSATATAEGILFLALNTNIARQFEFIQQSWINNPAFGGLHASRDPVSGANYQTGSSDPPESHGMVIPAIPFRIRVDGLRRFVRTRGGGYFFLPGLRALRYLAATTDPADASGPAD